MVRFQAKTTRNRNMEKKSHTKLIRTARLCQIESKSNPICGSI